MTFQPSHTGLYFGTAHIEQARLQERRRPLEEAWALLHDQTPDDALAALILNGLRWRFSDDIEAGNAAHTLQTGGWFESPVEHPDWDTLTQTVTLAHGFEMTRDHPAFSEPARADWLNGFAGQVDNLHTALAEADYVERVWLGLLDVVAGVILENRDFFERGVATYQQTVREDITPDGYMPLAVQHHEGSAYLRQLLAVKALILTAEVATLAGEDLWGYTVRGVSVTTAAVYLNYYYYFPEKWRWDGGSAPDVAGLLRQQGGYLEILNQRAHPKDIEAILHELRPLFDASGGGLTTLTHGAVPRRGWFGA